MKKAYALFTVLFVIVQFISAQESLDDVLKRYNNNDIPYISVEELVAQKATITLLDVREFKEYNVSHLKGAIYVGYDDFQLEKITTQIPTRNKTIVVYCSLGIRSEVIANKLKKAGYTNVRNLYGGIFEWKNKDFDVYNSEEKKTDSIHTYSKTWSKWLNKGTKVYSE
ncbi:rhodanese [Flavobacteriales bacterium 33_180_T64]|nr:rhodanese [Flavobacteriales bacterium 33_180_T64]